MKVAINGFGRIGKLVFRALAEKNLKNVKMHLFRNLTPNVSEILNENLRRNQS